MPLLPFTCLFSECLPIYPLKIASDYFVTSSGIDSKGLRTHFHQKLLKQREEKVQFSKKQAARSEILHTESSGFLEAEDPFEDTTRLTQRELVKSVDLQSKAKQFDLELKEFGPYGFQYTRNGQSKLVANRVSTLIEVLFQTLFPKQFRFMYLSMWLSAYGSVPLSFRRLSVNPFCCLSVCLPVCCFG